MALLILLGVLSLTAWQRQELTRAREEHADLLGASQEIARLTATNDQLRATASDTQRASAQGTSPELLRLRSEAQRLRTIPAELDRLRADQERLRDALARAVPVAPTGAIPASPTDSVGSLRSAPGFLAKETWADVGLGKPEETLQTFFRAARDGDIARLLLCVPRSGAPLLGLLPSSDGTALRQPPTELQGFVEGIGGFVVEERLEGESGQVTLGIRATEGGATLRLRFVLEGENWKMKGP